MTDLEKIITEVSPSLTNIVQPKQISTFNEVYNSIISMLALTPEEALKLKDGFNIEKNKESSTIKIFQETLHSILEKTKKDFSDKDVQAVYIQNKKILKDNITNNLQVMKNFEINEKELKITLLGTILQSLYDGRD